MPVHTYQPTQNPRIQSDNEFLHAFKDHEFDQIYPEDISKLSPCHWSPVEVCQMAALLLVLEPGTRVLDIGCGPGKFCAIGATTTRGHFTGVEQRGRLVKAARMMLQRQGITGVEIVLIILPVAPVIILTVLSLLSAIKFFAVILWFMHLIYDARLLFWLFFAGLALAFATFTAMIILFSVDRIDTKWFA